MRIDDRTFAALAIAGFVLVACGDSSVPSDPGGGGPAGSVQVGEGIEFVSRRNGTVNPAIDTVRAGAIVTWSWTGTLPHNVRSTGPSRFQSSATLTGSGTYAVTFTADGIYEYDCEVHGPAMRGRVVVLPEAPDDPGGYSISMVDPVGDTFHARDDQWDLTAMSLARDAEGITATLTFSEDVISPMSGDAAAVVGYIDLDLDQDPRTGWQAEVDGFRTDDDSTALGVDAVVLLSDYASDASIAVTDLLRNELGRVTPVFSGRPITIRIPSAAMRRDDGFVNVAAIVGTIASPSDFVPESGHLSLRPAVAMWSAVSSAGRGDVRGRSLRNAGPRLPSALRATWPHAGARTGTGR